MNYSIKTLLGIVLVLSSFGCMTPQEKAIDKAMHDQFALFVNPMNVLHEGDTLEFSIKSLRMKSGDHITVYIVPAKRDVLSFGANKDPYAKVEVVSGDSNSVKVPATIVLRPTEKTMVEVKTCYSTDENCEMKGMPVMLNIEPKSSIKI